MIEQCWLIDSLVIRRILCCSGVHHSHAAYRLPHSSHILLSLLCRFAINLHFICSTVEFVAGMPSKIINKTAGVEFTDPLEGFNHLNEVAGEKSLSTYLTYHIDLIDILKTSIKFLYFTSF